MSGPPPTSPLEINDEIKQIFEDAWNERVAALVAAVSEDGRPLLSFRGSCRPYSATQLGFWSRSATGGTLTAIQKNPNVAVMLRSSTAMLQFQGRARLAQGAEADQVYANAPEFEQNTDREKKGAGVIIDLDRIEGVLRRTPEGPVFTRMAR